MRLYPSTMTRLIIFVLAAAGLFLSAIAAQSVFAQSSASDVSQAKAIPDWVNNNFKWYGQGQIGQSDLLNALSFLLDNGYMHLSDKAAQEMQSLKDEVARLRANTGSTSTDDMGRVKTQFPWDRASEVEALAHISDTYDINPKLKTKVVQYDDDHKKWIDVLSINWESGTTTKGDPDLPIIVGQVPNTNANDRPTEEIAFYYNKISAASKTIDELTTKGATNTSWSDAISKSSANSVTDELSGIVVLCNVAMDNAIQKNESGLEFLKQLSNAATEKSSGYEDTAKLSTGTATKVSALGDITLKHAQLLEQKIETMQTGTNVCQEKLRNLAQNIQSSDSDQLVQMDLQNALQKQQQTMQMLSNIIKVQHDTAKAIIANMKG